jgi:hypothetical protein
VTRKSHATLQYTALSLSFSLFFIYAFMTQIETIVFDTVYTSLYPVDILLIIIGNAIPVIIAVLLGIKFFWSNLKLSRYARTPKKFTIMEVIVKLLLTGLFYMIIYFVATYLFYRWDNPDTGFIAKIIKTWNDTPQVYLIEFVRGLLYGIFLLPVINIFRKRSFPLLISLILLLETPAIYLLVPDCLFPNMVRIGDLWQTVGILFLFALTTWLVFDTIKAP